MQQVVVNIDNRVLERRLLLEANKKGRKLANIILEVLENNFVPRKAPKTKLHYKRLNPLKHISRIDYEIDDTDDSGDTDLNDAAPFKEIKDSAAYVREIRQNAWRR
ncbi:MAG: hypothetical protein NT166_07025 [Candidatus Aminicenantes bacterium]|nr:hypothetical protein [Candidatus Aminicenantes bacterium]